MQSIKSFWEIPWCRFFYWKFFSHTGNIMSNSCFVCLFGVQAYLFNKYHPKKTLIWWSTRTVISGYKKTSNACKFLIIQQPVLNSHSHKPSHFIGFWNRSILMFHWNDDRRKQSNNLTKINTSEKIRQIHLIK